MRRIALSSLAALALLASAPAAAPASSPDCGLKNARSYEDFGAIRTFTTSSGLYGCLTDVGRAYRLDTGTIRARSAATHRALFGFRDWVAHPVRKRSGEWRARATNLRTGERHGAAAMSPVTALVVNIDGTLAWIGGTELRAKAIGRPAELLGSDPAMDPGFLSLENDEGCAVTWRADGEQRSSTIFCTP
jgi:hypothetical protein